MVYIARWKIVLIILLCVFSLAYSLPNMLSPAARDWAQSTLPSWLPHKTVNLGLDLQGGSHLLLEVDVDTVIRQRTEDFVQSARASLRQEKIGYSRIVSIPGGLRVTLREGEDASKAAKILRRLDAGLDVVPTGDTVEAKLMQTALDQIRTQTIEQSIEIVRRRVDETGTREPSIARQGDNRIIVQLPGVGDPQRIKDILGKTAKLSFHLVETDIGRGLNEAGGTRNLPLAESPGQSIPIMRRAILTGDMLVNAQPSFQQGLPVVSFVLNSIGAKKFCDVTRENVNKPFAIVLDDVVISAPNIREPICGGSAVISGSFTVQETNDLSLLLRAGALPAPLEVMEERTVGPSLGADSVEAGKIACLMAMVFVVVMMIGMYGLFGIFASVALTINMAMILAVMSVMQATLTLPGIAGIVLTIGIAVDANVLVYERIKEELRSGRSIISSIDAGYQRAMASIIDSNMTSLIAALLLFALGTGPIKGFAVTMSIGIVTSYLSAILVTRMMVVTWLHKYKPASIPV